MAAKKKANKRKKPAAKKAVKHYSKPKKHTMAKRKTRHTTKRRTSRRRSISGTGGNDFTFLLLVAGGALAGRIASNKLGAKMNPKVMAGAQIAAGIFLPKMVKGNKMIHALGAGLAVNGILQAASSFGVIQGIAGMVGADEYQLESMSGTDQLSILAGDDDGMGLMDEGIMSGTDRLDPIAGIDDFGEVLNGMNDDESLSGSEDYE